MIICNFEFSSIKKNKQFNLENATRPGRTLKADVAKKKSLADANRRITTPEIAETLNLSHATVHKHIKRLGLICKLEIWVPHVLAEICINDCDTLIRCQRNEPFLKRIVTGDEK